MGATESVEVPYEETGALSPEQQQEQQTDRPEWLPEKFNSAEDMAKAYGELESKLGGQQTEQPKAEAEESSDLKIPEVSEKDMNYYSQRFAENGKLDEDDYAGLEKLGVNKTMVDSYIQGQVAMQEQYTQNVYNEVGGQEAYQAMTEWASNTLTSEEITIYDEAVNSGDLNKTMSAIKGLQARYQMENGTQPNLRQGKTTGSGVSAYGSLAEMKRDMADPRYHTDPAFRQQVTDKLAVSNIM